MTINYTTLLGLAKPVTGTETGQWGDVVNDSITSLLEDAVANAATFSVTSGNVTLTTTNGSSNQARMSTLIITGSPGTTRNVIAPSQAKVYVVINQSDGAVVIKGAATTGVTVGAGQTAQIAWNGSDFVEVGNYVHGNFVVNGNLTVNGNSTLGDAGADTTTINGQFIAANSAISKATTLTTSVPALTWIKGQTYTDTGTAGGTTQAHAPFNLISAPTLSTSNIVTYTNASTLYVAGAPTAGGSATITNPYALYVAAGAAYFGGGISGSTVFNDGTANGVLYLNGSKVATSGSALTFDGSALTITSGSLNLGSGGANGFISGNTWYGINTGDWNFQAGNGSQQFAWKNSSGGDWMRLTSTGLGIGTSSPTEKLTVAGNIKLGTSGTTWIYGPATTGRSIYSNSDSTAYIIAYGSAYGGSNDAGLSFVAGTTNSMTFNSSGNLGLGVTPSAWNAGKALQIAGTGLSGSVFMSDSGVLMFSNNYRYSGGDVYNANGYATRYYQYAGQHIWNTAPSGTAGNAITFTQAMTLDASGNLEIGGTFAQGRRLNVDSSVDGYTVSLLQTGAYNSGKLAGTVYAGYYDGSSITDMASIRGGKENTTSGNYGGMLAFYTRSNGGSDTERARITSAGDVLINTSSSGGRLVIAQSNSVQPAIYLPIDESTIQGVAAATQIRMGNNLVLQSSGVTSIAAKNASGYINFSTGSGPSEYARIDSSGNFGIGTSSPSEKLEVTGNIAIINSGNPYMLVKTTGGGNNPAYKLQADTNYWEMLGIFSNSTDDLSFRYNGTNRFSMTSAGKTTFDAGVPADNCFFINNSSSTGYAISVGVYNNSSNTYRYFEGFDNTLTQRIAIYTNGDVKNTNNSYGALSDQKLKQDIVDAGSQWNDIKNLRVRKYRFKDKPEEALQIGLIAQEVELVSPGLVVETPDQTRDKDGKVTNTGEFTKTLKYSVLYMKAVKALQEAIDRIEQLEAKVAALETK